MYGDLRGRLPGAVWFGAAVLLSSVAVTYVLSRSSLNGSFKAVGVLLVGCLVLRYRNDLGFLTCLIVVLAVFDRQISFFGITGHTATAGLMVAAVPFALAWRPRVVGRGAHFAAGMLALGMIVGFMSSHNRGDALAGTVQWLLILNAILGIAGHICEHPKFADRLVNCYLWCGLISGVFGFLQKAGHYQFVGPPYDPGRIDSTFGYYSNFGNFEAIACVFALGVLLTRRDYRMLAAATAVVASLSTVENLSRGGVVALAVGCAALIVFMARRPARALLLTGAVAVLYMIQPKDVVAELVNRFSFAPSSDVERYQLQSAGWGLLKHNPLGIGFNNFKTYVDYGIADVQHALVHSHNLYVQTGLDGGYLGLAGLVLLLAIAAVRGLRHCLQLSREPLPIQAIAAAAVLGLAAQGMNDFFFFEVGSHVVFAVPIALALALSPPRRDTSGDVVLTSASAEVEPRTIVASSR